MKYWKILAMSGLSPKILETRWVSPDSNNPNENTNTKKSGFPKITIPFARKIYSGELLLIHVTHISYSPHL